MKRHRLERPGKGCSPDPVKHFPLTEEGRTEAMRWATMMGAMWNSPVEVGVADGQYRVRAALFAKRAT